MAVDPFAIAGSLGLAAGLIGFVASTVEKAVGQISNGKHAQQRLLVFQIALQTCEGRVEAWAHQWYGHEETTREDSRFLWGPEGLREVENVKSSIQEEQNDILKLLYGRSWSNTHGQETIDLWAGILQGQEDALRQDHQAPPAPSDSKSKDIYTRISTALWKNNLLSTSVDRLKGLVENLETTSRLRFHKAQKSADHHRQPSNEEIGSVVKQHHRMRHLAHALSVAYQNLRPSAGSCELLFTDFDKAEMCRLEMQNELALTFLMKHSPSLGTSKLYPYRRLDVKHPLDSVHDSVICDQARMMLRSEPKTSDLAARGHTMRGEFLHISRLEKHQQDFHREDIKLDCMAIAVRIGSWSMLTWDSRWLSGLSSCRIVQMRFGDGETWPVFAPDSCSPEQCTSCHLETRPYLLLAVILAELALACPITITMAGGMAFFDVESTEDSTRFDECYLSESDLLKEIKSATSWHYRSAVKYCLEQDASARSRPGSIPTYNHAHFYRKVIEPLDRHCRPLRKHIEDHPELYKNFKQEASRFPVQVVSKGP